MFLVTNNRYIYKDVKYGCFLVNCTVLLFYTYLLSKYLVKIVRILRKVACIHANMYMFLFPTKIVPHYCDDDNAAPADDDFNDDVVTDDV